MTIDILLRATSNFKYMYAQSVAALPGEAIEVHLASKGFTCSPGQVNIFF
jgi:hypothetical protein